MSEPIILPLVLETASMSCNEPILSTGSSCGIILQQDLRVSGPALRVLAGHHGEVDTNAIQFTSVLVHISNSFSDFMRSVALNGTATEHS